MNEAPEVKTITHGLGMVFPDLAEVHRTWFAGLMLDSSSASPELADELLYVKVEEAVRAGNESAIQVVIAAARRGLKI